jgi:hypothetical protein
MCVSVVQRCRRVAARLSGAEGDALGRSWITNALNQNREEEGTGMIGEIPGNME